MLRITIEMVPGGNDDRAWTIAQGVIANDGSGTDTVGNYIYGFSGQARRAGHDPGIRRSGRLFGFHRRIDDVWTLLHDCLARGDEDLVSRDGTAFLLTE